MKIIKYILLLLLYVPLATASLSKEIEKKLPVFTGKWYIEGSLSSQSNDNNYPNTYLNQCLVSEYEYQFTSDFQEELIKRYIKTLPTYNCKWEVTDKWESSIDPWTYPTSDWDEILNQNTSKMRQSYFLECIEKNGEDETAHYEIMDLSPIYECPENTRAGQQGFGVFCLSSTNLCNADIAGRDLAARYGSSLGHVGLTTNQNKILEVLNENDVIQENPLEDFAKRTVFWGIVYGYEKQEKLTYMESINILQVGEYHRWHLIQNTSLLLSIEKVGLRKNHFLITLNKKKVCILQNSRQCSDVILLFNIVILKEPGFLLQN